MSNFSSFRQFQLPSLFSIIVLLFALLSGGHLAAKNLRFLGATEIDSSALNFPFTEAKFSRNVNGRSYQRSPVTSFKGYQYATYYDADRQVCVARRQLPAGRWQVIRFRDYEITHHDSHNVAALGICEGDGTIHLAFDHHKDALNYRVSARGAATNPQSVNWSTALFSSTTDRLGPLGRLTDVTYPSFISAPDGDLMFYYRQGGSGSGDGMLFEYDARKSEWNPGLGKFISRSGIYNGAISSRSKNRNPYLNGISYAGKRLHVSWGWRENSAGVQFNHDLNYAYSDDDGRTWKNSKGGQIGITKEAPISIDSAGIIVAPIPEDSGLSNQFTHYAYPDGRCHVVLSHRAKAERGRGPVRYHHYWRSAAGEWASELLPFSGSRPKLVGDDGGELYLVYESGDRLRVAKGSPRVTEAGWSWAEISVQKNWQEGGEGQIDLRRWESERILSIYGQELGGRSGAATALRVFDYQVSAQAILPQPSHGQEKVTSETVLTWTAGLGVSQQELYFGQEREAVARASRKDPEYRGIQKTTRFRPARPFTKGSTYYWRIDSLDSAEAGKRLSKGRLWSFTTD